MNFLNAIPGTPLEGRPSLPPLELLTIIALFRFILPQADIRTCGGREKGLRTLQPLMYMAGCNGTMIGNYLTTEGRNPKVDIQDKGLGLVPTVESGNKKSTPSKIKDAAGRNKKLRLNRHPYPIFLIATIGNPFHWLYFYP